MASGSGDKDSRWYFTAEQLETSPSRQNGIDANKELEIRQQAAYFIQDMGQRLRVNQLCINTAIVYMHRFYTYHSLTQFHSNGVAMASLFLAAKVEEQPRKLESVIQVAQVLLNTPIPEPAKEFYQEQAQDLVFNENVLLQTLGFDVAVDHPHTHVLQTCQLVKACKDLAQTSYFLASNSLHLTTMCLQYRPTVVACFCIHLACKWSRWEIPRSTEGKDWFQYVDKNVTLEMLEQLTDEFIAIYDRSPARLKNKLTAIKELTSCSRAGESSSGSKSQSSGEHRSSSSHRSSLSASSSFSSHHQMKHQQQLQQPSTSSSGEYKSSSHQKMPYSSSASSFSSTAPVPSSSRPRERPYPYPSNVPHRSSTSNNTNGPIPSMPRTNRHSSSGIPSSTAMPSSSHKLDQRNLVKDQRQHADAAHKNVTPAPPSQSMYASSTSASSGGNDPNRSHSSSMAPSSSSRRPPHPPHHASSGSSSSSRRPPHPTHQPQPSLIDPSSYDMNIRSLDTIDLLESSTPAPPSQKQQMPTGKAPSIFSPEWPDNNSAPLPTNNSSLPSLNEISGANGSDHSTIDANSKKAYDKRAMANDVTKKEKQRVDQYHQAYRQQQQNQNNLSTSSMKSMSASIRSSDAPIRPDILDKRTSNKRELSMTEMQYDTTLPQNLLETKPNKRPYDAMDTIDYRDGKTRRTDKLSPLLDVSKSMTDFDDDKTKIVPPLNGIETNPDLVSSLLKESLSEHSKSSSSLGNQAVSNENAIRRQQQQQLRHAADPDRSTDLRQKGFYQPLPHQQVQQSQLPNQMAHQTSLSSQSQHQLLTTTASQLSMDSGQLTVNSGQLNTNPGQLSADSSQLSARLLNERHAELTDRSKRPVGYQQFGQSIPPNANAHNLHMERPQVMPHSQQFGYQQLPQPLPPNAPAHSLHMERPQAMPHNQQINYPPLGQTQQQQQQQAPSSLPSDVSLAPQIKTETSDSDATRHKSEKKKKKEKHKNKDKEKSKDREERKKHKKHNKEKQKDRERTHSQPPDNAQNPIKITIPKDKLNLSQTNLKASTSSASSAPPSQQPVKLKIQNPIKDGNSGGVIGSESVSFNSASSEPPPLKLRIVKDTNEHYNTGTSFAGHHMSQGHEPMHLSSSKKKDRHRDKDKSKKVTL